MKADFCLPNAHYLLNHSVGRPLKTSSAHLQQHFLSPWQDSAKEPWQDWLTGVNDFCLALATLFDSKASLFCPQVNLSSALTKLLMSIPKLQRKATILLSEQDFPSMGFVLQKALGDQVKLKFIPIGYDVGVIDTWTNFITKDVDLVFISHVYSNTGQKAPIADIVKHAREQNALSIIDVAQSAGIVELSLNQLQPDFMIGSSVKWLCGGPGAAYLWVNEMHLSQLVPKDVGWFSHENPFEFDIHHFSYHHSALKFWGGTPSVAPYILASHSINYFCQHQGAAQANNAQLVDLLWQHLGEQIVSPQAPDKRSGTVIIKPHIGVEKALQQSSMQGVSIDARAMGLRVSPHVYNDEHDIAALVAALQ